MSQIANSPIDERLLPLLWPFLYLLLKERFPRMRYLCCFICSTICVEQNKVFKTLSPVLP